MNNSSDSTHTILGDAVGAKKTEFWASTCISMKRTMDEMDKKETAEYFMICVMGRITGENEDIEREFIMKG